MTARCLLSTSNSVNLLSDRGGFELQLQTPARVWPWLTHSLNLSVFFFGKWGWHSISLEKEMATHSSILAWRIPGIEEPGGLQSMGSQRAGHCWALSISTVYLIWPLWALNEITVCKVLNIVLNRLPWWLRW